MLPAADKEWTESDVEQKVVFSILTSPIYLGIPEQAVHTKKYLRSSPLEQKAGLKSGYIPDYAVWVESLPVLVCEIKAPSVDAAIGFHETALYARHINAGEGYAHGINPCKFILATNGITLLYGYWDAAPKGQVAINELVPGSKALQDLLEFCGYNVLLKHAQKEITKLKLGRWLLPAHLAGEEALLNSKLPPNTFAAELAPVLQHYFSSTSDAASAEIYRDAYVGSTELQGYDSVLESLLKDKLAAANPLVQEVTEPQSKQERLAGALKGFDRDRPAEGHL